MTDVKTNNRYLYALIIFINAFLLFQIQPVLGKFVLPWFGSSPSVWSVVLLFFQSVLVLGYLYAYILSKFFNMSKQLIIHGLFLLAALLTLPVIPSQSGLADSANPSLAIFLILSSCVGLPYLVLSATSPLLQSWYAKAFPKAFPYRLYALSNVGSLLALISFPFLFERYLNSNSQTWLWSFVFIATSILMFFLFWQLKRSGSLGSDVLGSNALESDSLGRDGAVNDCVDIDKLAIPLKDKCSWFVFSMLASVLLVSTTSRMSLDVPPVPFLFVLPLSVYLITFILSFDREAWYRPGLNYFLSLCALFGVCLALFEPSSLSFNVQLLIYCLVLFFFCFTCHGEIVRRKPEPYALPLFYFVIALGAALGSVFVSLVAPKISSSYFEYELSVFLIFAIATFLFCKRLLSETQPKVAAYIVSVFGVTGILLLSIFLNYNYRAENEWAIERSRNFYGVLRIFEFHTDDDRLHKRALYHGGIQHGVQYLNPEKQHWKTSYYGGGSGLDVLMTNNSKRKNTQYPFRIGGIGLGAGTIAAYANDVKWPEEKYPIVNDAIHFYEINPAIVDIADRQFTFLKQAQMRGAEVTLTLGDARMSMQAQADEGDMQNFDVLVVDAFSGDAIPMHLLSREAFELYFRHLSEDGVLAVHVSNQYLDLLPVIRAHAQALNKGFYAKSWVGDDYGNDPTSWIMLGADVDLLKNIFVDYDENLLTQGPVVNWTDDFSSLADVLDR